MPATKSTLSLKRTSLVNIAKNMEKIWMADYKRHFKDQGTFLFVIGPFECLTPCLIQELIEVLVSLHLLKRFYLDVLIDSRLIRLDLSVCKMFANKDSIMNLVATRCQRLTHLNIALCNQVSARTLADVVDALPRLQVLNLRQTKCNDQVLSIVGSSCRDLRDLNLFACPITDMGLLSMSVSFEPSNPKCPRLFRLDVSNTAVTNKGVEVLVKNLPQLHFLVYPDICEVLYRMHHQDSTPPQYQLRCLHLADLKANLSPLPRSIEVSCAACPFVTDVHFIRGGTDGALLPLSQLQHLRVLKVGNSDEELVSFEGGILPLLQICGSDLQELALFEVNDLDLGAVAACCPQLKKLSCLIAGFPRATFPTNTHPELRQIKREAFPDLQHVAVLLHSPENSFPEQFIRLLTVNARSLLSLHFAYVQMLTDSCLEDILRQNPFKSLQRVVLESCHHVSGEAVLQLLKMRNDLRHLVLKDCRDITLRDFTAYKQLVAEDNYDTNVEWV